jgi:hypothetical protein
MCTRPATMTVGIGKSACHPRPFRAARGLSGVGKVWISWRIMLSLSVAGAHRLR